MFGALHSIIGACVTIGNIYLLQWSEREALAGKACTVVRGTGLSGWLHRFASISCSL